MLIAGIVVLILTVSVIIGTGVAFALRMTDEEKAEEDREQEEFLRNYRKR